MDRYWDKMKKKAQQCFNGLDSSGWFDYWHCHIDWEGKGDTRPENREAAIALGFEILKIAEDFISSVPGPIQCWWFVHKHAWEDAVYLHSPNENGTPFPNDFKDVTWGLIDLEHLNQLVDTTKYKIGTLSFHQDTVYVVTPIAQ